MITELLNDSVTWTFVYTVITNLKRLKICLAFGFFRVFVIWVKRFLGAFKRHQVYSIGFAIHLITKGATIT